MHKRVTLTVAALALTIPATAAVVPVPASAAPAAATAASGQGAVPLTRNMKWSQYPTADWTTRDSAWKGWRLRHPNGGRFYPQVVRWANLVLAVMGEHRIPARYLPGILAQIQQESAGNPYAINMWDSNAAAGTPSKGLLQVIYPTYRAYAKPNFRTAHYQTVPYTNIWAALNYVLDRYGRGKFRSWNKGYNQGY